MFDFCTYFALFILFLSEVYSSPFYLFLLRCRRHRLSCTAQHHGQSIDSRKLPRNASTTLRPRCPRALQCVQIFHGGGRSPAAKDSFAPRAAQRTSARHPFSLQLNAIHWPVMIWPRLRLSVRASATCVRAGVRKPAHASRQSRRERGECALTSLARIMQESWCVREKQQDKERRSE